MTSSEKAKSLLSRSGRSGLRLLPLVLAASAQAAVLTPDSTYCGQSGLASVSTLAGVQLPEANGVTGVKLTGACEGTPAKGYAMTAGLTGSVSGALPHEIPLSFHFDLQFLDGNSEPIASEWSIEIYFGDQFDPYALVGFSDSGTTPVDGHVTGSGVISVHGPVETFVVHFTANTLDLAPASFFSVDFGNNSIDINPASPVPEPSTLLVAGAGLATLLLRRRG